MIPAGIFTLLLCTLLSLRRRNRGSFFCWFAVCFIAILLLFLHHASTPLDLTF